MPLSETIDQQVTLKGPRCTVGKLLRKLPPEDAADLQKALDNEEDVPGAHIARALKAVGHDIAAITIQRHRHLICKCR